MAGWPFVTACLLFVTAFSASGYQYIGCYIDTHSRDLPFRPDYGSAVSINRCNSICSDKGFAFFAGQDGNECWCGNSYGRFGLAPANECSKRCAGDSGAICGSVLRLSMYASDFGSRYIGCFADTGDRDLPSLVASDGSMTVVRCNAMCRDRGFLYAGLQSSGECWCGNSYGKHGIRPENECRKRCTGDTTVFCGGESRNNIFGTGVLPPSGTQKMSSDVRNDLSAQIRAQSVNFPSGVLCDNCLFVAWQKRIVVANSKVFPANTMDSAMAKYPEKVRQKVKLLQFGPSTRTTFEDFSIDINGNLGARRSIVGMARRVNENVELWVLTCELAAFLVPKYMVVNKILERRNYDTGEVNMMMQALRSETFKLFIDKLNQI